MTSFADPLATLDALFLAVRAGRQIYRVDRGVFAPDMLDQPIERGAYTGLLEHVAVEDDVDRPALPGDQVEVREQDRRAKLVPALEHRHAEEGQRAEAM